MFLYDFPLNRVGELKWSYKNKPEKFLSATIIKKTAPTFPSEQHPETGIPSHTLLPSFPYYDLRFHSGMNTTEIISILSQYGFPGLTRSNGIRSQRFLRKLCDIMADYIIIYPDNGVTYIYI